MIGFSLPIDGEIAVISYDAVHVLPIATPSLVTNYPDFSEGGTAYDRDNQTLTLLGRTFSILGLYGGEPRLQSRLGELITIHRTDELVLHDSTGREVFRHRVTDLSRDWSIATFTPDDQHILFGLPYDLEIFERAA